jgi:hypothetical protein
VSSTVVVVAAFAASIAVAWGISYATTEARRASVPTAPRRAAPTTPPADADTSSAGGGERSGTEPHQESAAHPALSASDVALGEQGPCPVDMVLVEAQRCPFVAHRCERKRKEVGAKRGGAVCERFRDEVLCEGRAQALSFCVDRFEYPNRRGARPAVMVDYEEAERACDTEGKRLCSVAEWQLACEGAAVAPYPTGLTREATVCHWDAGPVTEVLPSRGPEVAALFERADRRVRSGERPLCVSVFGVFDQAGNVREWVRDPEGSRVKPPFSSGVAGGAWGGGAATCRTLDSDVPPRARSASVGFRCCADPAEPRGADRLRASGPRPTSEARLRPILSRMKLTLP